MATQVTLQGTLPTPPTTQQGPQSQIPITQQGPQTPTSTSQQGTQSLIPTKTRASNGRFLRTLESHTFWHLVNAVVGLLVGIVFGVFGPLGYHATEFGIDIAMEGLTIARTANLLAKQESCRSHPVRQRIPVVLT